jgi:hypothetical protein
LLKVRKGALNKLESDEFTRIAVNWVGNPTSFQLKLSQKNEFLRRKLIYFGRLNSVEMKIQIALVVDVEISVEEPFQVITTNILKTEYDFQLFN